MGEKRHLRRFSTWRIRDGANPWRSSSFQGSEADFSALLVALVARLANTPGGRGEVRSEKREVGSGMGEGRGERGQGSAN